MGTFKKVLVWLFLSMIYTLVAIFIWSGTRLTLSGIGSPGIIVDIALWGIGIGYIIIEIITFIGIVLDE